MKTFRNLIGVKKSKQVIKLFFPERLYIFYISIYFTSSKLCLLNNCLGCLQFKSKINLTCKNKTKQINPVKPDIKILKKNLVH